MIPAEEKEYDMAYLVSYASHYGSTKQYAEWIADALGCGCRPAKQITRETLTQCSGLIHGGGLYAGGLSGISLVTKNFDILSEKQLIVFSCGLADPSDPNNVEHIETGLSKVLKPEMQAKIKQFHLRGGIDYSRLNLVHRSMMAMLRRSMLAKGYDNLRDEDKLLLDTYGKQISFVDRETIAPLIDYVRTNWEA